MTADPLYGWDESADLEEEWSLINWAPLRGTVPCHDGSVSPQVFDPRSQEQLQEARAICEPCPLVQKAACREMAVHNGEWGVWGGAYYRWGELIENPRIRRD